jgi:hypothetical protein
MQIIIDEKKAAETYKAEFDASPEIREEFGNNFEIYSAYRLAEDRGLIGFSKPEKRRLTTLQTIEKIQLQWSTNPYLRDKWPNFDAFRAARWKEEMAGR